MNTHGAEPERFGRLTLLDRRFGRAKDGHLTSRWRCECGAEAIIPYGRAKRGATSSCGCLARERSSERATKHGGRSTAEYSSWMAMRRRCEDKDDKDYSRYGARGISVHPSWSVSFGDFLAHIGPRPAGTTLDRKDARLGYIPGNVRWATPQEQGRNRHGTYTWHIRGRVFETITDAAQAFSVSEHTVWRWVNGQFDNRRGTMTPPRSDCSVVGRYE